MWERHVDSQSQKDKDSRKQNGNWRGGQGGKKSESSCRKGKVERKEREQRERAVTKYEKGRKRDRKGEELRRWERERPVFNGAVLKDAEPDSKGVSAVRKDLLKGLNIKRQLRLKRKPLMALYT